MRPRSVTLCNKNAYDKLIIITQLVTVERRSDEALLRIKPLLERWQDRTNGGGQWFRQRLQQVQ